MKTTRICPAITGLGAVTPYGLGVRTLWENLLEGKTALSALDLFAVGDIPCQTAGVVRAFAPEVVEKGRAYAFAVAALEEALLMAERGAEKIPRGETVLVLGSNFGCAGYTEESFRMAVAQTLGLSPLSVSLSLSCASGAAVLATAADLLQEARIRRVVAVGVDELSPLSWSGLCALRTMSPRGTVRPFDAARDGTVFSEGAGAIVLERDSSSAVARLCGWATGNNGYHLTLPPPRAAGSLAAMQKALARSGFTPGSIDAVIAHATGTKANDASERDALSDLFGDRLALTPVTACKALLGHLMGAAGTVEAIVAVQMLCAGVLPPTDARETPDPACDLPLAKTARPQAVHRVLLNSAGIGGCNAAAVLGIPESPAAAPMPQPDQTVQIAGQGTYSAFGVNRELLAATWARERTQPSAPGMLGMNAYPLPDPNLAAAGVTAKGYLDPQEGYFLAACGQAFKDRPPWADCGLMGATALGPARTRSAFHADYVAKGARLVKPLLFPHTYDNAAASLAAIEWALTGSHGLFNGGAFSGALAVFAAVRAIQRGEASAVCAAAADSSGKVASAAALLFQTGQDRPAALVSAIALGVTPDEAVRQVLDESGFPPEEIRTVFHYGALPGNLPAGAVADDPLARIGTPGAAGFLLLIQLAVSQSEPVLIVFTDNGSAACLISPAPPA